MVTFKDESCNMAFQNCMIAYNDDDQALRDDSNEQNEFPHLNKALECATNEKTIDNGCVFENIRYEANDLLKSLLNFEMFSSCGVTAKNVDKLLAKNTNFIIIIVFSLLCVFLFLFFIILH